MIVARKLAEQYTRLHTDILASRERVIRYLRTVQSALPAAAEVPAGDVRWVDPDGSPGELDNVVRKLAKGWWMARLELVLHPQPHRRLVIAISAGPPNDHYHSYNTRDRNLAIRIDERDQRRVAEDGPRAEGDLAEVVNWVTGTWEEMLKGLI